MLVKSWCISLYLTALKWPSGIWVNQAVSVAGLVFYLYLCVYFSVFVFLYIPSKWPTGYAVARRWLLPREAGFVFVVVFVFVRAFLFVFVFLCISSKWPPGICSSQAVIVAQRQRTPPVTTIIITGGHWPRETVSCHHMSFDVIKYSCHHFQESSYVILSSIM